ncbi:MAG: TRAP transporter substrate-binding protein [Pelagibacteraceae bacterium]|jgi:tripartite ATP-independent transporter DctP family solute receptor|nr:TRAP transporter substrate-binding protein [Pelagibacteraceae bacterium]MCI5079372.1 TRAP transporter substrate-binding protein [Pelagibacteraceae bacterium]
MKNIKTLFATIVSVLFLSSVVHAGGHGGVELKFGHVGKPGSLFHESAEHFKNLANQRLGKKGKVVTFGSSQLGKDKQLLQKVKAGTVNFALPSSVMSSVHDEFGVFDMPYMIKDRNHMAKVEKQVLPGIFKNLEAKTGYKVLAVWENGFRQITNNKRPINTPSDLKGIKLRTPKSKWRVKMFQTYGANPTPMAFSEVFTALKTGTMDGQENPYAQIASAKFQEVQKYLSISNHVYTPAYVVVHKDQWNKVPADVRKIVEQAAQDTQKFVYKRAAELEVSLLKVIKDAGVKVNTANRDAFVKGSAAVYKQFGDEVSTGNALIKKVSGLAK